MRLDQLLVERGLSESREKARRAIMAGEVRVGDAVVDKAGTRVKADALLTLAAPPRFVGRGGQKLEAALDHFALDPGGRICLDIGASTGGFTDCLLQRGAAKVYAIDVGHSQLDWKIRSDPRVVVREKINARFLSRADVAEAIEICVIDVSFISLTLILPPAFELLSPHGVIVALIKPQFELRKTDVGKGGIIRDETLRQQAVERVREFVEVQLAKKWRGVIEASILGAKGNQEFLACLAH